ncbi:DsbA family protein [Microbulbifer harenosus]|uniref:DsbA family protein n=1 Tax=Microbulbifer harenosus TaxID=2576840 RepID=A0ABY2UIA8_9GAMM|nr:DsbA family protein [Microbulbifer harenosus]TLM76534.1 DsbA family protein [Microbulbifer harenosus]
MKLLYFIFLSLFSVSALSSELKIYLDPYCPYCKRVLRDYERLDSNYDLELVWAPILGEGSREYVRKIYECSSSELLVVIESAINGQIPRCEGSFDDARWESNIEKFEEESVSFVPKILLDGKVVSWNFLKSKLDENDSGFSWNPQGITRIDWERYREIFSEVRVGAGSPEKFGLIFPDNVSLDDLENKLVLDERYSWFVVKRESDPDLFEELVLLVGADLLKGDVVFFNGQVRPAKLVR